MAPDTKRVIRTVLQVVAGIAAGLPLLVHTANLPDTLPGVGVVLAVAAATTKLMAAANPWLPAWLRLDNPAPASTLPPQP